MNENAQNARGEVEIDLVKLFGAFLKKWWLIAILVLVGGALAFAYTYFLVTPLYRTYTSFYVNNSTRTQEVEEVTQAQLTTSARLVATYINIVGSDRVMSEVRDTLGDGYTVEQLKKMMTAQQVDNTEIFNIYVTSPDPAEAARVCNVIAEVAPEAISSLIEGSSARIIDYAKAPTERYSPSYTRNTSIGIVIGLFLALAILTIHYLVDTRIKDEEELTAVCDYPILGQIPDFSMLGGAHEKRSAGYGYGYGYAVEQEKTAMERGQSK